MAVKVSTWDVSEYLETEEDIAAYLNAVVDEGDPVLLQAALGDVAKARGMSSIAKDAGVSRESLYRSLSVTGNPSFQTVAKVADSLGLQLHFQPASAQG